MLETGPQQQGQQQQHAQTATSITADKLLCLPGLIGLCSTLQPQILRDKVLACVVRSPRHHGQQGTGLYGLMTSLKEVLLEEMELDAAGLIGRTIGEGLSLVLQSRVHLARIVVAMFNTMLPPQH